MRPVRLASQIADGDFAHLFGQTRNARLGVVEPAQVSLDIWNNW
jgi:hypothetical protein